MSNGSQKAFHELTGAEQDAALRDDKALRLAVLAAAQRFTASYSPAEPRAIPVDLGASGEDMADELRERSENIGNALDAAFDRGADAYIRGGDRDDEAARYFDHPKLQAAFCEGWDEAAEWDDDDSFTCSMDRSMRDTHGVPGRDL